MRFVDEIEITCISGKGGAGAVSFRREMYVPRGGPNGGDGGRGGNIVFEATTRSNTLDHLRGQRLYKAEAGVNGLSHNMHGRRGEDHVIQVPVGTVVVDLRTGIQIADLSDDGSRAVICRGGEGGRGNVRFKSATNRTPRQADPGGEPEEKKLRLELKLIADVGLLGFPNAGKSTLISTVSNARPKVADYPFTTLIPNLGVVSRGYEGSFVIADIPGLVRGASEGVGLGHRFLKHVERCRFFLHLVSVSSFMEDVEDPLERHRAICAELQAFSPELAERPQIVVLTKIDLVDEEELNELMDRFEAELGQRPLTASSVSRLGIDRLLDACWLELQAILETDVVPPPAPGL